MLPTPSARAQDIRGGARHSRLRWSPAGAQNKWRSRFRVCAFDAARACLMLPGRRADRTPSRRAFRGRLGRLVRQGVVPTRRGFGRPASHDVLELLFVDGLILDERLRHEVQLVERGRQDLPRSLVVALDHPPHFHNESVRGDVRHLFVLGYAAPQEHFAGILGVSERTELVRQTPLRDHVAREIGRPLDVVRSARRHRLGPEDQFFGNTAAKQRCNRTLEPALREAVAILFRQELRDAQRATARDDGHFVYRVVLGDSHTDDGMTGLVISRHLLLGLAHHHGAPLGAHHDLVLRTLELVHAHHALVGARGEQGGLVHEVGEVGAGEAWRTAGDIAWLHVVVQLNTPHVYTHNLLTASHVWHRHHDLPVEAARAQQGRIQDVRPVRGGDDNGALIAFEAIHLVQQLVQGLLTLVVPTAQPRTAVPANGVDLVDENGARRGRRRRRE